MSPELLVIIAGTILSLLFSYVAGFTKWWEEKDGVYKRLMMLILLVLTAGGVYGISCLGYGDLIDVTIPCTQAGLVELIRYLILAVMANQSVYALSPQPAAIKQKLNGGKPVARKKK